MDSYDAYQAITDVTDDQRWAFGTGFDDPLSGVDTSIPDGVPGADLGAYCEMLGDDALIMSHRLQQWVAHAPELEEEAALANIALDLLGQASLLLARAGAADGSGRTDDDYAFRRGPAEFRNVRLVELVDGDFGVAVARLLVFSTWRLALLDRLRDVRLGRGVHDHVDALEGGCDVGQVADVAVDEPQPLVLEHVGQVGQVPGVGEGVHRDDLVRRLLEEVADHVRGDEPGAAGDKDSLHRDCF